MDGTDLDITTAELTDLKELKSLEWHIREDELKNIISLKRIYLWRTANQIIGWLRYGLFWDNTPFMNMLYVIDEFRCRGIGTALIQHWENEMKKSGFDRVMTSTASDEYAQHFYVNLGYKAVGGFIPNGSVFEVIFEKSLTEEITDT